MLNVDNEVEIGTAYINGPDTKVRMRKTKSIEKI